MKGLSAWLRTPQAFLLLTVLVGVNAVLEFALGTTVMGIVFTLLAATLAFRAWRLWRGGASDA